MGGEIGTGLYSSGAGRTTVASISFIGIFGGPTVLHWCLRGIVFLLVIEQENRIAHVKILVLFQSNTCHVII